MTLTFSTIESIREHVLSVVVSVLFSPLLLISVRKFKIQTFSRTLLESKVAYEYKVNSIYRCVNSFNYKLLTNHLLESFAGICVK